MAKDLRRLSSALPSENDIRQFIEIVDREPSDRSAAIMAAGLLEQSLEVAIRSRLADPGDKIADSWFDGANAPFATFSAKITLGRALGIYGPEMEKRLSTIKNVRNVFAHRSTPIDFGHPALIKHVAGLWDMDLPKSRPARTRYCALCVKIAEAFIENAFEHGGKEISVDFP